MDSIARIIDESTELVSRRDLSARPRPCAGARGLGDEGGPLDLLADALADRLTSRLAPAGLPIEASKMTGGHSVAFAIREYLEGRGREVRSQAKQILMAKRLLAAFGPMPAAQVRQRDVDQYVTQRRLEGASAKTSWNELALLRTVLRYSWRNGHLTQPPSFQLHRPRSARQRVCWPEEMQQLVGQSTLWLRRVILSMYAFGLRRGEVLALRWAWVHHGVATIPGHATKTGEPRTVDLGEVPALWYMLQLPPRHPVWVFPRYRFGRNGLGRPVVDRYGTTVLQREWRQLLARCEITDLRLHDLRRSMASVGMARGHALAAVQAVGGWADPGTLQRHYAWANRGQRGALSRDLVGTVLSPAPAVGDQPNHRDQGAFMAAQGLEVPYVPAELLN